MVLPVPTPPHMYSPRGGRACMGELRPPKMLCHLRARGRTHAALDAATGGDRPAASAYGQRLCTLPETAVPDFPLVYLGWLGVDGCAKSKQMKHASAPHQACRSSCGAPAWPDMVE
jgi:hypothetical protein